MLVPREPPFSRNLQSNERNRQFISEFQNSMVSALVGIYIKEGYLMGHHKDTEQNVPEWGSKRLNLRKLRSEE